MIDFKTMRCDIVTGVDPKTLDEILIENEVVNCFDLVNGNITFNGESTKDLQYNYYIIKRSEIGPIEIYAFSHIKVKDIEDKIKSIDTHTIRKNDLLPHEIHIMFHETLNNDFINKTLIGNGVPSTCGFTKVSFLRNDNDDKDLKPNKFTRESRFTRYYENNLEIESKMEPSSDHALCENNGNYFSTFEEQELILHISDKTRSINADMFMNFVKIRNHIIKSFKETLKEN